MSYIGSTPSTQSFTSGTDYFNGDGSTVAFTLTRRVNSVNDIEVVVNNVQQQPNSAYNVSGTTLTFTGAPSSGTSNIYVRYLSTVQQSINLNTLAINGTPASNTFLRGDNTWAQTGAVNDLFYENAKTITGNVTVTADRNASTTGPLTIASGATLTVPSTSRLVIL